MIAIIIFAPLLIDLVIESAIYYWKEADRYEKNRF